MGGCARPRAWSSSVENKLPCGSFFTAQGEGAAAGTSDTLPRVPRSLWYSHHGSARSCRNACMNASRNSRRFLSTFRSGFSQQMYLVRCHPQQIFSVPVPDQGHSLSPAKRYLLHDLQHGLATSIPRDACALQHLQKYPCQGQHECQCQYGTQHSGQWGCGRVSYAICRSIREHHAGSGLGARHLDQLGRGSAFIRLCGVCM